MVTNRNLFRQTGLQKMQESQQLFFGLRLGSRIFEEFQQLHFGGFFHQIKVRQPTGERILYTSPLPKNEKIGGICVFSGTEL
jgi:hypothetical protein